ncbi:MAG: ABC transporter ATP-binding protein [Planctomycetota bacterium]|nr:MAG: ABC transporter ATP-binding protein [Planctomycetota bacterium]
MANEYLVPDHSIKNLLIRLWLQISSRRKKQFFQLLILMLFASFSEILSIGSVIPFLAVLTSPEMVFKHEYIQPIIKSVGITKPDQLLLPLTLGFCGAIIVTAGMRLLLVWASIRLSFASGADLSFNIYNRTLYQPYSVHCSQNSSEVINGITMKTNSAIGIISNVINIISSVVMLVAILLTLFLIAPYVAFFTFGVFGLMYGLVIVFTRKKLALASIVHARESSQIIKILQEGLGGIRDVLIDGSQKVYSQIFVKSDQAYRRAQASITFVGICPRQIMEAIGMLLIAGLAYVLILQPGGIVTAIPILGALAIGAQRMLPVLQQAYAGWSGIVGYQSALLDIINLLEQPMPNYLNNPNTGSIKFEKSICLKNLDFRYNSESPDVLKNINLIISKGDRIGFIGTTGSGKSTLLDIVMGLLVPTKGDLIIDDQVITTENHRDWQVHIAHVPQAIFLSDSSIAENIAFGVPKEDINIEKVEEAAMQAQINETIDTWPLKYQTLVGERGVRLSGGQRQRIGIARALYKKADVIIFDEATSALDNDTEEIVMRAIESLSPNITILIIAHRITTLKNCTKIVDINNGTILDVREYDEIQKESLKDFISNN